MRTMLASFIAILVLATGVLAQDDNEPKPEPKPEPAAGKEQEKTDATLGEIIKELESQLGGEHDAALRKLIEHLREQVKSGKIEKAKVVVVGEDGEFEVHGSPLNGLGLVIEPGGAETMNGSFEENGRKGKYTLKSAGEGQYVLEAEITGDDGATTSKIKDKGTFAALRAKYKWLRGGFMFAPRAWVRGRDVRAGAAAFPTPTPSTTAQPLVGVVVRPPSDELRYHLEVPVGAGLIIDSVTPGSRADKLGLRRYDVLLRIDGELVEEPEQVKKLNEKGVTLQYIRRAQPKRLVTE